MHDLSAIIGANLADIRKKRGLSLDKIAELSGVSKAMVGQIERGESNPTVATLWKIALGLRISFSQLISEKRAQVEVVRCADIHPVVDDAAGVTIYPVFPFEQDRHFEIFLCTLDPSASHASDPHAVRSEEYVLLIEGYLEVTIGATAYRLGPGDAIRCHADKPHFYRNLADKPVRFLNIIYYANPGETTLPAGIAAPAEEAGLSDGQRRETKRAYKDNPPPMGVLRITNQVNGKTFLYSALNLPGAFNSQRFQLKTGTHPNRALQSDWNTFGPDAFAFEAAETLTPADIPRDQWKSTLAALEKKWLDTLRPYGDKGYNKPGKQPKKPYNPA